MAEMNVRWAFFTIFTLLVVSFGIERCITLLFLEDVQEDEEEKKDEKEVEYEKEDEEEKEVVNEKEEEEEKEHEGEKEDKKEKEDELITTKRTQWNPEKKVKPQFLRSYKLSWHKMRSEETAAMSQRVSPLAEADTDMEYWLRSETGNKKLEDEYLLGDIIGRGNSSTVYRCLRKGRSELACKILKKKQLNKKAVQSHIKSLLKLKHSNIVHLKEVFETKDEIQLIQELAEGGELFERIVERGQYSEEDAAQAVRNILNGLQYLHSHDIIHRDLKPENLLYQTEMEDSVLKIADYGMSNLLCRDGTSRTCGSIGYKAPEILQNKEFDSSADMWSLGVITYIMLCGFEPFWDDAGEAAMVRRIIEADYSFPSPWWDEISESAKELISKLLTLDPKSRPTAVEALNHPWTLGISAQTLHMNQTILRLRELNGKRRFRVATKAVLATCRALNFISPAKKMDKAVLKCFCENSKDSRTEHIRNDKVKLCCDCSLIDGSVSAASDESISSLTADGKDVGKNSTKLATKVSSSQYKENYVGLG